MSVAETNRRQAETINRGLAAGCVEPGSSLDPWIGDDTCSGQEQDETAGGVGTRDRKPENASQKCDQLQDLFRPTFTN